MDRAKNIEEFINEIADRIGMRCCVRYNLNCLEYGEIHQSRLDEYGDYCDMTELPDDIEDEFLDWEIDEVKYLREDCDLPYEIEPPRTWVQIDWMADFANENTISPRFVNDAQRAIN